MVEDSLKYVTLFSYKGPVLIHFVVYSMSWYKGWSKQTKAGVVKGKTLLDAIDAIEPPRRHPDRPLRLPIDAVYKIGGIGTVVAGRIEAGIIKPGMLVSFAPSKVITEVRSVEMHREQLWQGSAGDNVGFSMKYAVVTEHDDS